MKNKILNQIVKKSNLSSEDESANLLNLLADTCDPTFVIEDDGQKYTEFITIDRINNMFRGNSVKLKNFEFKIEHFLSGLAFVFVGSTTIAKAIEVGVILKTVFDSMRINIDEKECFILFTLHNYGEKDYNLETAFTALEANWETYREYKQTKDEFIHSLHKLASIKAINFNGTDIFLIESISVRYR